MRTVIAVLFSLLALTGPACAELVKLDIHSRTPFAEGKSFGEVGPYEKLVGVATFAIDPGHVRNKIIVDLDLAPRNAQGKVEFTSDVCILQPKDLSKCSGAMLYDVNNRGNKLALRFFNDAFGSNDPSTVEHAGNGFLFRKGYIVVWCGWIGELLPGGGRMLLKAPVALKDGKPLTGIVRYEMGTDKPTKSLPLSRRDGHGSYSPTEKGEREGRLTWRLRETDERVPIPREQWSLQRLPVPDVKSGVSGTLGQVRMTLAGGFRPGYIYELVCEASGSIVQGVGFAAVRDLLSFLKYDTSAKNPVYHNDRPRLRVHGFGVSQSGRFLRHFTYQGFNADERGRKVFDGLMPHVAGGGLGFFNHRFAQPTRHNGQHEDHLYPADVFPFTYGITDDDFEKPDGSLRRRGSPEGILSRLDKEDPLLLPYIMHTQSAAEYWHRSGSLVHTNTLGTEDAKIPWNVRIYSFGGTQHGPASWPPSRGGTDNLHNPGDYRPFLRGLLVSLDAWVTGTKPPPSVYPRISDGTLVDWRQKATKFPSLPGVRYPEVIQQPSALDLGDRFRTKGIITIEPPRILGNYRVLVPASDADGNDRGTLLPIEVAEPTATYTGWNLRTRDVGAEAMLANLTGSYIPFPRTEKDRLAQGDPRISLEKRYGTFKVYRERAIKTANELVKRRYLLAEELERLEKMLLRVKGEFAE